MIIRIFRVTVFPERREDFRRFFLDTARPLMAAQDGIEAIHFGLPRPETPNDFAIVMVWRDLDALKAFVGEDWRQAHVHPDEEGIVISRALDHFELAA